MSSQPGNPVSTVGAITDDAIRQALAAAAQQGQAGAASPADMALVPLWITRSTNTFMGGVTPAVMPKTRARDDAMHGTAGDRRSMLRPGEGVGDGQSPTTIPGQGPKTKAFAESYWMEMSDQERQAFADRAKKAGMWDPAKDNDADLVRVWAQAVDMAWTYNGSRQDDQAKWLSPFEVLDKLYGPNAAANGKTVNGFDRSWHNSTNTTTKMFSQSELEGTAKSVLQAELHRDPTDSELKAYLIAVNKASAENPQVTTSRQRATAFDANGNPTDVETNTSVSGGFDPSQTIQDQVKKTDEWANVQAAVDYFPAVMQALGAIA